MTTFLSKQRKNELQEIADLVGLKTYVSHRIANTPANRIAARPP
jgi:hypothetical protein